VSYNNLITQNIAPLGATKIGVYNSSGEKVGKIELSNLKKTGLGNKLYSFGAISDIHLQDKTAQTDFQTALDYLDNKESVVFTCICGDLTTNGTDVNLQDYKNYVESYSPNTPVYGMSGNHDARNGNIAGKIETYTGHPLYYSFEHKNDVFIFVGINKESNGNLFTKAELQWLYETLETNRNKRCFVFEHVRPQDTCGNAYGIYNYDIWGGTEQTVFESMMKHYKNVILFHGHSHLKFNLQTKDNKANYEHDLFGIHSIHIPSLAVPRTGDITGASSRKELYAESEGYVVDVYENAIVLRGRDFVNAKFLPIATYCLDTTLQTIVEKTYTDSTGTIDTSNSYSITNTLSNATNSNTTTSITKGGNYTATISANTNYSINSITVTMGGIDVTSSVVSGNNINISNVIGDVVITVTTISNLKPCTNITLNNSTLTFTTTNTQTLVATVTPTDTTDTIVWSVNNSNATVVNGVVTPKKNGTCIITATCGSKTVTCNVTINCFEEFDGKVTEFTYTKIDSSTGAETTAISYYASNYIELKTPRDYTIYFPGVGRSSTSSFKIVEYDADKNFILCGSNSYNFNNDTGVTVNFTASTNTKYIRLRVWTNIDSPNNRLSILNGESVLPLIKIAYA
jgi:predicted MPP superfamily phosphohydrolase